MRPINKGSHPLDEELQKITFNKYGDAKPYLIDKTCRYCHFCEMPILNSPAVEHLKNKDFYPNLIKKWENLMLICVYCNSRKPKKKEKIMKIKLYNHYFPHIHNTFLLFDYVTSIGIPTIKANLNNAEKNKAESTLKLYGLQGVENSEGEIDTRYEHRLIAFS
jgi:hypothetical protein